MTAAHSHRNTDATPLSFSVRSAASDHSIVVTAYRVAKSGVGIPASKLNLGRQIFGSCGWIGKNKHDHHCYDSCEDAHDLFSQITLFMSFSWRTGREKFPSLIRGS